jgi:hypothetical protein
VLNIPDVFKIDLWCFYLASISAHKFAVALSHCELLLLGKQMIVDMDAACAPSTGIHQMYSMLTVKS